MNDRQQLMVKTSTAIPAAYIPPRSGVLQQKCACGGTPGPTGECAACRRQRRLGGAVEAMHGSASAPVVEKQRQAQAPGPATGGTGGGSTPPTSIPVTASEIGTDLTTARTWATTASQKMQRYSRVVRSMAVEPTMSHRISTTRLGRGQVHGVNCPLQDNFNLDPQMDAPTQYAARLLAINDRLGGIKSTLDSLGPQDFRNMSLMDSRCEDAGAFVINKSRPIYLCGGYWLNVFGRPATLIHEVAHLRQMSDEQYIRRRGMGLPASSCRIRSRFTIDASSTIRNPDSYAYFCADLRR